MTSRPRGLYLQACERAPKLAHSRHGALAYISMAGLLQQTLPRQAGSRWTGDLGFAAPQQANRCAQRGNLQVKQLSSTLRLVLGWETAAQPQRLVCQL